jgi:3-hydroxyacyl-CoA dehydrogenase/enoyl-CoA hydratase/3-hydroxybutyryl-CoA epimerase
LGIELIDQVMRRFGMPMGPLELLDQVGLDVVMHIAQTIQPVFGDRFPVNPAYERMVQMGWLGQKVGTGFYHHRGKKGRVNKAVQSLLRGPGVSSSVIKKLPPAVQSQQARERMVLLMVNEAAACLGEGVVTNADTIDLAMVLGTGWAPHRGGPLGYAGERGLAEVVRALTELTERLGPRFEPCAELRRRAASGALFHGPGLTEKQR